MAASGAVISPVLLRSAPDQPIDLSMYKVSVIHNIDNIDLNLSLRLCRMLLPAETQELNNGGFAMWKLNAAEYDDQVAADWPQKPIPLPPMPY